jgi:hypothetical protein
MDLWEGKAKGRGQKVVSTNFDFWAIAKKGCSDDNHQNTLDYLGGF